MDLTKAKKAVNKAAAELIGAARDVDWQATEGWGADSDELEPEERGELTQLAQSIRKASQLAGMLAADIVKLEQKIHTRKTNVPKKRPNKQPWQVTS